MAGNDWDRRYKVWYNKVLEDMDSLDVNWEDVHPFLRLLMDENITSIRKYRVFCWNKLGNDVCSDFDKDLKMYFESLTVECMKDTKKPFAEAAKVVLGMMERGQLSTMPRNDFGRR